MSDAKPQTDVSQRVIDRALSLGFTAPKIASLSDLGDRPAQALSDFIASGYHGSMAWMEETQARRSHPNALWPEAKSAIILGLNYGPDTDPLLTLDQRDVATISVYARNRDYHDVIKGRLKDIAGLIARDHKADVKVFVDTAPLMEKPLAALSGLGWQGKHTNLVSREYGSWLFLGTILTDAELTPDKAETDHCGSCTDCLDICPTHAFDSPYKLDARKCISYLTIEHKGPIDVSLRSKLGNRIYGCDDCLAVCPWNKFAHVAREAKLKAREDLNAPRLEDLLSLDDPSFRKHFSGSPIKRIGRAQFIRNVIYAIGNSQDVTFINRLQPFLLDPNPTLQDAAHWAISELSYPTPTEPMI